MSAISAFTVYRRDHDGYITAVVKELPEIVVQATDQEDLDIKVSAAIEKAILMRVKEANIITKNF